MVEDVLNWLAALSASAGNAAYSLTDAKGGSGRIELTYDADAAGLTVQHSRHGTLTLAAGEQSAGRLVGPSRADLETLRTGFGPSIENIRRIIRKSYPAGAIPPPLAWLLQGNVRLNLLVIPGLTALRARLGAASFGPLKLPEIEASVSLRNVALDLRSGAISLLIRIHDAAATGSVEYATPHGTVAVAAPRLWLDLDVSASLTGSSMVTVDGGEASFTAASGRFSKDLTAELFEGRLAFDRLRIVRRSPSSPPAAEGGTVSIGARSASLSTSELATQAVQFTQPRMQVEHVRIALEAAAGNHSGSARLERGTLDFESARVLYSGARDLKLGASLDPSGHPIEDVSIDLSSGTLRSARVSVARELKGFSLSVGGLTLSAPSDASAIRLSVFSSGGTERLGLQMNLPEVLLSTGAGVGARVTGVAFNRSQTTPAATSTTQVLAVEAVNEVGFRLERIDIPDLPAPNRVELPISSGVTPFLTGFGALLRAAGSNLDKIIEKMKGTLGDVAKLLVSIVGAIGGLGEFGILVQLTPTKVRYDRVHSHDDVLAFRFEPGVARLGTYVKYWTPSFKLKKPWDIDKKWHTKALFTASVNAKLPPVVIQIRVRVDAMARAIKIEDADAFFDGPGDNRADELLQKLVLGFYGVDQIKRTVLEAVRAKIPLQLPASWNDARVSVDANSGGIDIWLGAVEHIFAPLPKA